MLENGKIGLRQFTVLVILFTIGGSILVVPSGLAVEAKRDAWIAAIIGVGIGLLFLPLYNALGKLFPEKTLGEYSEDILGKWLGKLVSLLFLTYWFILSALLLRDIGYFMTTVVMPETPIHFINILYLAIVIMAVRLGLETLTRAGEILFPWVVILFLFLIFSVTPEMEFIKLQPILEEGIKPVLRSAFPFLGLPFLELIVFLYIFPYVNKTKEAGKALITGTLIGGIFLIIIVLVSILVLGADLTARNVYSSYTLAKKISIGGFLERLESIMAGIWFITLFFKLVICFYATALGLAQTLKLKEYRMLLLPLGMILLILSLVISPNDTFFKTFLAKIWTPYSLTYGLFLPLLLLSVAKFRKQNMDAQSKFPRRYSRNKE